MKKRNIICFLIAIFACILYGIGAYNTTQKYTKPEQKFYGLNETVECNGISYTLLDMKAYSLDEILDKYNTTYENMEISGDYEKKYYVACVEVKRLSEDGQLTTLWKYNKYSASAALEPNFERLINGNLISNIDIAVGESIKYYYVKSFLDYAFTEETWNNLDESDMWLRMYNDENHYEIFLGTEL